MVKFIWQQSTRIKYWMCGAVFMSQALTQTSNQVHSRSHSTKFKLRFIFQMSQHHVHCSLGNNFDIFSILFFKYLLIFTKWNAEVVYRYKNHVDYELLVWQRRMIPCQRRETCVFDRLHREKAAHNRLLSRKKPKTKIPNTLPSQPVIKCIYLNPSDLSLINRDMKKSQRISSFVSYLNMYYIQYEKTKKPIENNASVTKNCFQPLVLSFHSSCFEKFHIITTLSIRQIAALFQLKSSIKRWISMYNNRILKLHRLSRIRRLK